MKITKHINKKFIYLFFFISVLIFSLIIILQIFAKENISDKIILKVNNESVIIDEYKLIMESKVSEVTSYFKQKYDVDDNKDFWSSSVNGEIPLDMLKKLTTEELVKIKVQQIKAKAEGVFVANSYSDFLSELKNENNRRESAVKEKKVIYGKKQYSISEYYRLLYNNMVSDLKKKLEETYLIKEEDIKEFYDKNKESYKLPDDYEFDYISIEYKSSEKDKELINNTMSEICSKLKQGADINTVVSYYNQILEGKLKYEINKFDKDTMRTESIKTPKLSVAIRKLKVGQTTEVLNDFDILSIGKVRKISANNYRTFEDAKESIKNQMADDKYNLLIEDLIAQATIEFDNKLYIKIDPRNLS